MIKYLGSKRVLVPTLGRLFAASGAATALDLFTGTTRVAQEFCRQGATVTTVDSASYSHALSQCYVELDAHEVDRSQLVEAIATLEALPSRRGYFTRTFCEESRYFQPKNGMRVDAIRDGIDHLYGDSWMRPVLLTSLMEAADAVDSTVGLQMAYLKQWAPRAFNDLRLRIPEFTPGTGVSFRGDATHLVNELPHTDLAYLDPPYNQHRYFTNYHIWETLTRWDAPEHYGIACKRADSKQPETKSIFNMKREMPVALAQVIKSADADVLMVSFSNEGFVKLDDLVAMCVERGETVEVLSFDNKRYVGALIGIFNPSGDKVGSVSHTRNTEYVILSGPSERITHMAAAVASNVRDAAPTLF